MNNLADPGVISDILKRHGFTFSKGLGQNFLVNPPAPEWQRPPGPAQA